MLNRLFVFVVCCTAACGSQDLERWDSDAGAGDSGIGTLEQPIYADDGYGSDLAQNACRLDPGWSGGKCNMPDSKTLSVAMRTDECVNDFDGIDFEGCIASGVGQARTYLNSTVGHNWNMGALSVCTTQQCTNGKSIIFRCSGSEQSGIRLALTATSTLPQPLGTYECHDAPGGEVCQYGDGRVTSYWTEYQELPYWSAMTATQKCTLVKNVTMHEVMHWAGLGHEGSAISLLMRAGGPIAQSRPGAWTDAALYPTSTQKTALQRYNPTSNTTPQ